MEQKEFWVDIDCSFKVKASNEEIAIDKVIAMLGDNGGCYINISDVEEIEK